MGDIVDFQSPKIQKYLLESLSHYNAHVHIGFGEEYVRREFCQIFCDYFGLVKEHDNEVVLPHLLAWFNEHGRPPRPKYGGVQINIPGRFRKVHWILELPPYDWMFMIPVIPGASIRFRASATEPRMDIAIQTMPEMLVGMGEGFLLTVNNWLDWRGMYMDSDYLEPSSALISEIIQGYNRRCEEDSAFSKSPMNVTDLAHMRTSIQTYIRNQWEKNAYGTPVPWDDMDLHRDLYFTNSHFLTDMETILPWKIRDYDVWEFHDRLFHTSSTASMEKVEFRVSQPTVEKQLRKSPKYLELYGSGPREDGFVEDFHQLILLHVVKEGLRLRESGVARLYKRP